MNSEDLNKSHYKIWEKNPEISQSKEHTKLSIQFSIEVLESFDEHTQINDKIQELKKYLNEKI